jgi:type IV pilus assembly protein PilA
MQKFLKKESGFTLIELIIVMVIIGILVILLLPNLSNGPKRGRDSERKSELRTVASALEQYFADKSAYPPSGDYAGLSTHLVPDYIKDAMPADPKSGQTYTYTKEPAGCDNSATNCSGFTASATLEYAKDKDYPTYSVKAAQ